MTTVQLTDAQLAQFTACGLIVVDGEPCTCDRAWLGGGEHWSAHSHACPIYVLGLWRKLTDQCPTCKDSGWPGYVPADVSEMSGSSLNDCGAGQPFKRCPNPDCVGGRQVVTLTATCPTCKGFGRVGVPWGSTACPNCACACPSCGGRTHPDESIICATCDDRQKVSPGVVTLGRFTIRLLPVAAVADVTPGQWPRPACVVIWPEGKAFIMEHNADAGTWASTGSLDPLPQPGQWAVQLEAVDA